MGLDDAIMGEHSRRSQAAAFTKDSHHQYAARQGEVAALARDFAARMRDAGSPGARSIKVGRLFSRRSVTGWSLAYADGPTRFLFIQVDGTVGRPSDDGSGKVIEDTVSPEHDLKRLQTMMAQTLINNGVA